MSILKSRIFRTIAVLGCAAFCGVLVAGCNSDDSGANSTGTATSPKTGGAPASTGGMAPGGAAPTSTGS